MVKENKTMKLPVSPFIKQSRVAEAVSNRNSSPVHTSIKQSKQPFWVKKNIEVFKEDFSDLWVVSRLLEFNDWIEIVRTLKLYFNSKSSVR